MGRRDLNSARKRAQLFFLITRLGIGYTLHTLALGYDLLRPFDILKGEQDMHNDNEYWFAGLQDFSYYRDLLVLK